MAKQKRYDKLERALAVLIIVLLIVLCIVYYLFQVGGVR